MRVNKYMLDWMIKRFETQCVNSIEVKLAIGYAHYVSEKTFESKERVLTWLRGLKIAYKNDDHKLEKIEARIQEMLLERPSKHEPTPPKGYGAEITRNVINELLTQQLKWANKGYKDKELNSFLMHLARQMNNKKLENLVRKHSRLAHKNLKKEKNDGKDSH
jgi:hypothetical protein